MGGRGKCKIIRGKVMIIDFGIAINSSPFHVPISPFPYSPVKSKRKARRRAVATISACLSLLIAGLFFYLTSLRRRGLVEAGNTLNPINTEMLP